MEDARKTALTLSGMVPEQREVAIASLACAGKKTETLVAALRSAAGHNAVGTNG